MARTLKTQTSWDHIQPGDRVEFDTNSVVHPPRLTGTVKSAWGSPAQLDIEVPGHGVWVRRASDVIFVERPAP